MPAGAFPEAKRLSRQAWALHREEGQQLPVEVGGVRIRFFHTQAVGNFPEPADEGDGPQIHIVIHRFDRRSIGSAGPTSLLLVRGSSPVEENPQKHAWCGR